MPGSIPRCARMRDHAPCRRPGMLLGLACRGAMPHADHPLAPIALLGLSPRWRRRRRRGPAWAVATARQRRVEFAPPTAGCGPAFDRLRPVSHHSRRDERPDGRLRAARPCAGLIARRWDARYRVRGADGSRTIRARAGPSIPTIIRRRPGERRVRRGRASRGGDQTVTSPMPSPSRAASADRARGARRRGAPPTTTRGGHSASARMQAWTPRAARFVEAVLSHEVRAPAPVGHRAAVA